MCFNITGVDARKNRTRKRRRISFFLWVAYKKTSKKEFVHLIGVFMNKTKQHINLSVEKMSAVYKVGNVVFERNEKERTILNRVDIFFLSIGIIIFYFFGRFMVACELHTEMNFCNRKLTFKNFYLF